MKKIFLFIAIFSLAFTLIACGNPYMGKIVKKDMTRTIQSPSGENHRYTLNHIIVDYTYTVYPEKEIIILKGSIDDRQDADAHFVQGGSWNLKEAYLDIYFQNAERRVVDYCRKAFSGYFFFPHPLAAKCRYKPSYRYAALAYWYKYVQSEGGPSEVIKIYEHKLDIVPSK